MQTHEQDLDNVRVTRSQVTEYVFIKTDIHTTHALMKNYIRYEELSMKNWLKTKNLKGINGVRTFLVYFFLSHRSTWEVRNKEHMEGHKTPVKISS